MSSPDKDGYDRLNDKLDTWGERASGAFADRPIWTSVRTIVVILVVILVVNVTLSAIFGVGGLFGAWGKEAKRVVSPDNVTQQYAAVIDDWESLIAGADNACQAGSSKQEEGDPTFVESPSTAYSATYRKTVVDYNRRQANIFEAKKVGPKGYPNEIPRFTEATGRNPDWCAVGDRLAEIGP